MTEERSQRGVRAAERTLRILFTLAGADRPLSLGEINAAAGIDKATALRFLSTLESYRLVRRDEENRRYSLGSGAWLLASSRYSDLKTVAEPLLRSLRDLTDETISLVAARGLERVVLTALEATHELRVVPALNQVVPVYSGASGKVFMAWLPEDQLQQVIDLTDLKPVNERSLTDRATFIAALEDVRRSGYAVSVGDVTLGAAAIAAPVFGTERAASVAVSLRGPEARLTPERVERLAPLVVETARAISREWVGEDRLAALAES